MNEQPVSHTVFACIDAKQYVQHVLPDYNISQIASGGVAARLTLHSCLALQVVSHRQAEEVFPGFNGSQYSFAECNQSHPCRVWHRDKYRLEITIGETSSTFQGMIHGVLNVCSM